MLAIFPEISSAVQSGNIERTAILARRYFCQGQPPTAPRVDIAGLIASCGIPVTRLRLQEFGMIAVSDDRGSVRCSIAIKDGLSDVEESFLLAHLLGHFLLHVQPRIARTEWTTSGFRDEESPLARYTHERVDTGYSQQQVAIEDAADRFAGAILMPAAMLKKAKETLQDTVKVAKMFAVTPQMVDRRLEDLATEAAEGETPLKIEVRPARKAAAPANVKDSQQLVAKRALQSKEDTAHMVREKHHQAAPTPRAVATQSYTHGRKTQTETQQHVQVQLQTQVEMHQDTVAENSRSAPVSGKGMERLREIARMLDKSGR